MFARLKAVWAVVRPVLAKATDLLNIGRSRGWWEEGQGVNWHDVKGDRPDDSFGAGGTK